ncbi:MAG: DNA integrity scanning protein DisA nucleotide-binding domain protein [Spirochaetes bacterium]|nr:DNA integrity scanning protein DisA nucleotide-binding domain protein [Spirochaetota bacterium]
MNLNNLRMHAVKIKSLAEKIFHKLDAHLDSQIYLVVMNINAGSSTEILIEPSDQKASSYMKEYSAQIASEGRSSDILFEFEISNAVKKSFSRRDEEDGKISFFSVPQQDENYMMVIVLRLNSEVYSSHFKPDVPVSENSQNYPSLLDAIITRFLRESSRCFSDIIGNRESILEDNEVESNIIKLSANSFMLSVVLTAFEKSVVVDTITFPGMSKFFDQVNLLSSLLYEGRECVGGILMVPFRSTKVENLFTLEVPVSFSDLRAVRKLLEMRGRKSYLLYNSGKIYGFGMIKETEQKNDLFSIVFKKHYYWVLKYGDHDMMTSIYGTPMLSDKPFNADEFRFKLKLIFPDLEEEKINGFLNIVTCAAMQKHGTIIVISKNADSECDRLRNQAVRFSPFQMTSENLMMMSNIDGAVILDSNLMCHAVGVILDGMATHHGDPSRGSRYNSAIRYIESQKKTAMAVVVSEDGMVDFI